jgi:hypothetical protein
LVHFSLNPKCTSKLFFDSYVLVLSDYSEWICRWYFLSIEFFSFSFLPLFWGVLSSENIYFPLFAFLLIIVSLKFSCFSFSLG